MSLISELCGGECWVRIEGDEYVQVERCSCKLLRCSTCGIDIPRPAYNIQYSCCETCAVYAHVDMIGVGEHLRYMFDVWRRNTRRSSANYVGSKEYIQQTLRKEIAVRKHQLDMLL